MIQRPAQVLGWIVKENTGEEMRRRKQKTERIEEKKEFSWKDLFYRRCRRRYCNNYASLLFFTRRLGVG